MRLKPLFDAWQADKKPSAQTAHEFKAAVDDFIDFAGDLPVSAIDGDLIYDYRDEAAKLPAYMPRADRLLPFRERVRKHVAAHPKCSPATLKKRVGGLQALLSYAHHRRRWIATNPGAGVAIENYTKVTRARRSFEDHELAQLFACPLFTDPAGLDTRSRIGDETLFWLFLLAATTGARLEEVGQAALADVHRARGIAYLDISDYVLDDTGQDGPAKSVKTTGSIRLVPIHERLIALGFLDHCDGLARAGETQLFPDLKENKLGKRTKEASQRAGRIIDRYVSKDRRLVFHSLRHAFKAKGNDADLSDRILDQICGHVPVTVGGRYGSEPRIRTIHEALHRIDFSCIDWDRIVARTGR